MQINLTARHMDITPAIESFAKSKLEAIGKHFSQITNIKVVLHIDNITHIAEGTLHYNGSEIHATAQDDDMYKAVSCLADKLMTQLNKHKAD